MNGTNAETTSFLNAVDAQLANTDMVAGLAVPYTALQTATNLAKNVQIAAENVCWAPSGAFTGEISIDMLNELNVNWIIIGHSERRQMFGETDETVNKKAIAILNAGKTPIICVGETLETYEAGKTKEFVANQIEKAYAGIPADQAKKTVIAYEPIWAIGTGKTATPQIAQEVAHFIRETLAKIYDQAIADEIVIQYGGSVKPANIHEILEQADIDGALVGGASLKANDYLGLFK